MTHEQPPETRLPETLPRVLPLEEAAREMGMSVEHLTDLVQSGRVPAYLAPDGKSMMVPVPLPEPQKQPPPVSGDANGNEPRRLTLEEINRRLASVKREDFAHLEGKEITVSEAIRRYGISKTTLYRWIRRGYITVLHQGANKKDPTLLNEADIAFCHRIQQIREEVGILRGAPLLTSDKKPHLLRRPLSLVTAK